MNRGLLNMKNTMENTIKNIYNVLIAHDIPRQFMQADGSIAGFSMEVPFGNTNGSSGCVKITFERHLGDHVGDDDKTQMV
jgi:hypothetical protein